MKTQGVAQVTPFMMAQANGQQPSREAGGSFGTALETTPGPQTASPPTAGQSGSLIHPETYSVGQGTPRSSSRKAAASYAQQAPPPKASAQMSGFEKYKDDQLLRNPGGDHYNLTEKKVVENPKEQQSFTGRIGKDLSDVFGNVKNFFGNLFMGSKIQYRDQNNQIKEADQRGLVKTVLDFFKNMGSALTFGAWHPDTPEAPQGFLDRLTFSASRLKRAVLGDALEGIPRSINHMSKNLVLAGWNLIEVVPDATLGNVEMGRKLTTSLFDNGQVAVEYLTDIVPSGDAWFRVHAGSLEHLKPPILYNLTLPEHTTGDTRWEYVRNTPFRKTIETIGTLLADVTLMGLFGQSGFSGNQGDQKRTMLP